MDEYINVIWQIFEIIAIIAECSIITFFVTKMIGYKSLRHGELWGLLLFSASCLNNIVVSKISNSSVFSATSQIVICIIFSLIFLRGNILYKIFISMASVFIILLINSAVLALFSLFFKTSIYLLISRSGTLRLAILITTKVLYFIVVAIFVRYKSLCRRISVKKECIIVLFTSVNLLILANILFATITNKKSPVQASVGIILLMLTASYLFTHISKRLHNSQPSEILQKIDIPQLIDHKKVEFSKQDLSLNVSCSISYEHSGKIQENICLLISAVLDEVISSFDYCKYTQQIDFEIYITEKKISIIVSHYLKKQFLIVLNEGQKIPQRITPFHPDYNKQIKGFFKSGTCVIYRSLTGLKVITNIWVNDLQFFS